MLERVTAKSVDPLRIDVESIAAGGAAPALISLRHKPIEQPAEKNGDRNKGHFFESEISRSHVPNVELSGAL